jgi:hypothetical protein
MSALGNTWLVVVDVVDGDAAPARKTLIVESYDGTARGAEQWAADVFDWCVVYVRSVSRVSGELIETRETGRLDEVAPAPPANSVADGRGGWVVSDSHGPVAS